MSPETLQTICQVAMVFGSVLAALGGYGSWHYSQVIGERDRANQTASLHEISAVLSELQTNAEFMAFEQRQKIGQLLSRTDALQEGSLRKTFPGGYAIVDIRGNDWFVLPRTSRGEVLWKETQILRFDKDAVTIAMPTWILEGDVRISSNTITLARIPGAQLFPIALFGYEIGATVLENAEDNVQIAMGIRPVQQ